MSWTRFIFTFGCLLKNLLFKYDANYKSCGNVISLTLGGGWNENITCCEASKPIDYHHCTLKNLTTHGEKWVFTHMWFNQWMDGCKWWSHISHFHEFFY